MKWEVTSGRRKKKAPKPNAAQRALAETEAKMLAKHAKPLEKGAKARGTAPEKVSKRRAPMKVTIIVEVPLAPVIDNATWFKKMVGSTAPVGHQQYTGTKMLGTGQMHKSNEVPVFSQEEAIDIARMRRG